GAKGAAINVGVAGGFYHNARHGVKESVRVSRTYSPDRTATKLYAQLYPIYRETAQRQMELWDEKARIFA
ncbi:MAG TPA: hypothetical protein VEA63_06065, partial [Opitutus sp.]|nr:hypothetical protein [Opitutus sp.]